MATYAVGDIQGCLREFEALLAACAFDPARDRLWLTGDLVNRGPDSLGVVRRVMALGPAAVTVLGNHDLHLLALALVPGQRPRRGDTLDDILGAPDRDDILAWLCRQPLFHADPALGYALVHAGLPPQWDLAEAAARAHEVEAALGNPAGDPTHPPDWQQAQAFLATMYGDTPARWDPALAGAPRLRFITNCLTRMRYCRADGSLDLREKGAPAGTATTLLPWYAVPDRRSRALTVVFGHWSTLRLDFQDCRHHGVYPLDTGAVWGDRLSALRLEDRVRISVSSSLPRAHE